MGLEKHSAENPGESGQGVISKPGDLNWNMPKTPNDASLATFVEAQVRDARPFRLGLQNTFMACHNHPVYIQLGFHLPRNSPGLEIAPGGVL